MHRRQLLGLTASSLVALSGCASVARNFAGTSNPDQQAATTTKGGSGNATSSAGTSTEATTTQSSSSSSNETKTTTTPKDFPVHQASGPIPRAPVSNKATDRPYATMGYEHASAKATLYGNWKCPYTRDFVNGNMRDVVKKYVEPGDLRLEFRALAYRNGKPYLGPDAPRAARAGLAVWDKNPQSFWTYFATIFASQPNEDYQWATPDQLLKFAKAANVGHQAEIKAAITSDAYSDLVKKTVHDAHDLHISAVPRLAVGNTVTSPTVDYQHTKRVIEREIKG